MTPRAVPPLVGTTHLPLRELVATEMRRQILDGQLAPGERLIEDRLAEQLGVSRNPVREAIRVLCSEGFIEVTARRGAFVSRLSADEALNLFDVRLALEPLGARLAARSVTTSSVAALEAILDHARAATDAGDLDALSTLNSELHSQIFAIGDNRYLESLATPMVKRSQWMFRHSAVHRAPHSWREHRGLIAAIRDGDEELAESQARGHVLAARASFLRPSPSPQHATSSP